MNELKRFRGFAFALLLTLMGECALAQVPQGIPYQAVARNGQGQPLANLPVKVRFSVLDSTASGPVVYSETHEPTTSAQGLFSVNVGMGNSTVGSFGSINWGVNAKFLKVELDTTASGNNYLDLGTQQMMSVPYALYAGSYSSNSIVNPQIIIGSGFNMISNSIFNGTLMQTLNYCYNLIEASHSDWRLPTREEVFNFITLNGFDASTLSLWTVTNSNYNVLGPGGEIFPFTRFSAGEIYIDSPYSIRNSRCVR